MKKLFLISLLIGNVAWAKVGSLVTGALVGGAVGYVAGKSGGGDNITNYNQVNVYECNCGSVECNLDDRYSKINYVTYKTPDTDIKCVDHIDYRTKKPNYICNGVYHEEKPFKYIPILNFPKGTAQIIYKQDITKPIGCELIK